MRRRSRNFDAEWRQEFRKMTKARREEKEKQEKEKAKQERKLARATNSLKERFVTGQSQVAPVAVPSRPDLLAMNTTANELRALQEREKLLNNSTSTNATTSSTSINTAPTPAPPSAAPPPRPLGALARRFAAKATVAPAPPPQPPATVTPAQPPIKEADPLATPKPRRKMLTFKVDEDVCNRMRDLVYFHGARNQQQFLEQLLLKAIDDMEYDIKNGIV